MLISKLVISNTDYLLKIEPFLIYFISSEKKLFPLNREYPFKIQWW